MANLRMMFAVKEAKEVDGPVKFSLRAMLDNATPDPVFAANPEPVTVEIAGPQACVQPVRLYDAAKAPLPSLTIPSTMIVNGACDGYVDLQQVRIPPYPLSLESWLWSGVGLRALTCGGASDVIKWSPKTPLPVPATRVTLEDNTGKVVFSMDVAPGSIKSLVGYRDDGHGRQQWGGTFWS